jgi:hypothetical protein
MSTVTISTVIQTFSAADRAVALAAIAEENQRLASLTPPGTPLPFVTAQEIRASYQTIMADRVMAVHRAGVRAIATSNTTVRQIRDAALVATDAQRTEALTALTT